MESRAMTSNAVATQNGNAGSLAVVPQQGDYQ